MATMKVALGTFARAGIESELGSDLDDTVRAALTHYRGKLESGRPPLGPPSFFGRGGEAASGESMLEVSVDPETEAVLVRAAAAKGLAPERLAAHTVLLYLAELDFLTSPGLGSIKASSSYPGPFRAS